MANQHLLLFTFILGFGVGITTFHLNSLARNASNDDNNVLYQPLPTTNNHIDTNGAVQRRGDVNLDPFPLPPCVPNRTSALYVFYGRDVLSDSGDELFNSISSLLKSNFPGRVRVVIDQRVNETIREETDPKYRHLLNKIELNVVSLPDLEGKELIPHSNKIRALQARAFVHGNDSDECTVSLDADTYVHETAPWNELLSILQLHDVAVTHDCRVRIAGVPDFLSLWMPNTGVLALRNTPRTRMVLRDWLHQFKPCNATHVSTCTPGTDQYPFLQLMAKHAVRLHKLDHSWNCRLSENEVRIGIKKFPVYSMCVISNQQEPASDGTTISTTCSGPTECHILHGHWLEYPNL